MTTKDYENYKLFCLTDLVKDAKERLKEYDNITGKMRATILVNEGKIETIDQYKELVGMLLNDLNKCKTLEVKQHTLRIEL